MSNKVHRTAKGTELPLMNLQGKDYLAVQWRVVWFREEHPTWSIRTEIYATLGYVKAWIVDETGRDIASAHKSIKDGSKFPLESAETGAIGRALALCGFGTAFTNELDESDDEIADAPVDRELQHRPECSLCGKLMVLSKAGDFWFCPDYRNISLGKHPTQAV